jgi:hypothetical protein
MYTRLNRRNVNKKPLETAWVENKSEVSNALISIYICTLIILFALIISSDFWHWFLLPVWACGVLIGIDAVNWLRRRIPVFDPVGIIGFLGVYFFFLAPLLHVYLDYWMRYVTPPAEWRYWLGWMAVLNFLGLLIYRLIITRNWHIIRTRSIWKFDETRFPMLLFLGLLFTFSLQVWVYGRYGGLIGYIRAYEAGLEANLFAGMGWIFMLSESFSILLAFGYAYYARKTGNLQSWKAIILFLLLFFVLRLFFGGMRGSRSNTIWTLFWAAGIIHFWIRPLSHRFIIFGGLPILLILMYIGGLYKAVGSDIVYSIDSISTMNQLAEETGRDLEGTLLGDLGRSDVQALVLSRIIDKSTNYELALGRTYYGTLGLFVPRSIWPDRPPLKVKEGTDILYGKGVYEQGVRATRVYGLAGETMLNFGPWLVPIMFIVLGMVVSGVRSLMQQLDASDTRWLLLPLLINLCFIILVSDSDNVLFFVIKQGTLPFLLIFVSSYKVQRKGVSNA